MGKRKARYESSTPTRSDKLPPLKPLNKTQADLIHNLTHRELNFVTGPFGSSKTYVPTRFACELLETRQVEKIIVSRPMVTSEEEMGFLPGTLEEKYAPFFAPVREVMEEHLGKSHVANLVKNGRIEIAPIAFLRGHTFKKAFVLFDEAQNTTPGQMKLLLSRIGEGTRVCVSGDLDQMDIPYPSGLHDAVERLSHLPEVGITQFGIEHIVRSKLVQKIANCYK